MPRPLSYIKTCKLHLGIVISAFCLLAVYLLLRERLVLLYATTDSTFTAACQWSTRDCLFLIDLDCCGPLTTVTQNLFTQHSSAVTFPLMQLGIHLQLISVIKTEQKLTSTKNNTTAKNITTQKYYNQIVPFSNTTCIAITSKKLQYF